MLWHNINTSTPNYFFFYTPSVFIKIVKILMFIYLGLGVIKWEVTIAFFVAVYWVMILMNGIVMNSMIFFMDFTNSFTKIEKMWDFFDETDDIKWYDTWKKFEYKNWNIKLDGILTIESELKNVKWRLDEENIFLWESGKISGIPTLYVATNDVEASHSCKMEKISDEKLFYLRSRWIKKNNALQMMIEGYIFDLFKCLNMIEWDFYEKLILKIKKKLI